MQCEQVLEAVKLGEESQEIWDHLATCVSCRTKCESTAFVFDRSDPTDKRAPAPILDARRRWLPFVLLFTLIPLVAGLALLALRLKRRAAPAAVAEVVVAPPPRPSVTPVAIPLPVGGPATRRVAIDATPSATVWLDGKKQGPTPFEGQLPDGKVAIELRADGYRTVRKTVQVAGAELKLAFNLQPRAGGSSDSPSLEGAPGGEVGNALPRPPSERAKKSHGDGEPEPPPPVAARRPDPEPEPEPEPKPRAKAAPADDDDALPIMPGGFGFLTINCEPYAKVILDGKDIGRTTPLSRYSVPPGHHTVELRARNGSATVEVNVKPRQAIEIDKTIE